MCVFLACLEVAEKFVVGGCRVEKSGEHGEHAPGTPKVFPGTRKARNYLKDVWKEFQAICTVKIA